ncbi:alkaline phosphatase [Coprinopsis sp. MPI-PUGE-AT-0042]|nr:alkaline phosphatase [Coprinopsis sp. MPI-PUGE-AT-0042]
MRHWLPPIFSTLFRAFAYIFLQIIPTSLGPLALPVLYVTHLLSLAVVSLPTIPVVNVPGENDVVCKVKSEENGQTEVNGQPVEITAIEKSPSFFEALLFSKKSRSYLVNALNIGINTLLLAACADLALNPMFFPETDVTFARVGAVYPDSAKITVRWPPTNGNLTEHDAQVLYRPADSISEGWKDGPAILLQDKNDWVATVKLDALWPETVYEYVLSDLNKTHLADSPQRFQTFPDPRLHSGSHFKFLVTSCIIPNFPYKGPQERLNIKGFDLLESYLRPAPADHGTITAEDPVPEEKASNDDIPVEEQIAAAVVKTSVEPPLSNLHKFMLFLGDFVYADVPLYFGDDSSSYMRLYRRVYASPSFQKVLKHLPIFFAYDDHEFINNYQGEGVDVPPYANATQGYGLYNGQSNYDSVTPGSHYYNFTYGDVAFFVLDTRRHRSNVATTAEEDRTMLGQDQYEAFYNWLSRVNQTSTFKFVVSSVPFTSLWQGDAQKDSWAGFANEKAQILEAMQTVPNVFVLSGDRHEFAAVEFPASANHLHPVHEFSASPLNMFYIPYIRTLKLESDKLISRVKNTTKLTDEGPVVEVQEEFIPEERALKYLPDGNSKWSSIEIDTRNYTRPILRLEAVIDGKPVYHLEIIGTPVYTNPSKALISIPLGLKHLLGKLGFQSKQWF